MRRLLSFPDLLPKGIRYSRPHLYRLMRADKFPRTVRLGGNCVAFVEDEIEAWIEGKIRERDERPEHELAEPEGREPAG